MRKGAFSKNLETVLVATMYVGELLLLYTG